MFGHPDHLRQQIVLISIRQGFLGKGTVNLDAVRRKVTQTVEIGISCSKIIQKDLDPKIFQALPYLLEMPGSR